MSRWWTELLARLAAVVPVPVLVLLVLAAAGLVGALWYWFPAWVPHPSRWRWRRPSWRRPRWPRLSWPRLRGWRLRWRWPGWRWPGWRWRFRLRRRRRAGEPVDEPVPEPADELPAVPVAEFRSLADRLAAEGRYAEAIRERLRAVVRDLVDRGVVEHRPGWTVTELVAVAGRARPPAEDPLTAAARLFSEVWYGQRPATAAHDHRMRLLTERVHAELDRAAPVRRETVGAGEPR